MEEIRINTSGLKYSKEYVCWIDTMGTKSAMSESFEKAANFLIRFHYIVMDSLVDIKNVRYYPVMDGIYLTPSQWDALKKVVRSIYSKTSEIFIKEEIIAHRFVIRGAIAYGQVAHGTSITNYVCRNINADNKYMETLLIGMPMIQAVSVESYAPPFGLYIHESAREIKGLQGRYYTWTKNVKLKTQLREKISQYFYWCQSYSNYLGMSSDKIGHYLRLNEEHLTNMRCDEKEFDLCMKVELKNDKYQNVEH